jgi:hypothetical protein
MRKYRFSALILLLLSSNVIVGQNTYEFLRLDASPRPAALAGTYVANADDPNVIFYNPAGMANLSGQPISFSYLSHLADINYASISYSHKFEGIGRFGAGIQYINYGTFTEADQFGNKTGDFSAGEMALLIGYSGSLEGNFYYGGNVKFIYSSLHEQSSSAIAADLGLQYVLKESNWVFGFSALNMGSQMSSYFNVKESLPLDIRLGFSKRLEHMPFEFFFSFNKLNEEEDRFSKIAFGGEFRLSKAVKLRFGYDNEKRKELKIGSTAGMAGFSFGVGVKISDYIFDYALSSMGSIGSLHRIGISTEF